MSEYKWNQNRFRKFILSKIQHYDHVKYWKRRKYVIYPTKKNKLLKYYYLLYIKKCDAFNNCSFGTDINVGADFKTPPILKHGPKGIIINPLAKIGANCTLFHDVTIGVGRGGTPTIGDNCIIYPGAKIFGKIMIGNNVVIGANSVVNKDVPDNAIVAGVPARIIRYK